jgi:hypothetical protein
MTEDHMLSVYDAATVANLGSKRTTGNENLGNGDDPRKTISTM